MTTDTAALQQVIAAWVQAIGSIRAILVAIWVAAKSRKDDRTDHAIQERRARVRTLMSLTVLVGEFRSVLESETRFRSDPLNTCTLSRRMHISRLMKNIELAFHEFPLVQIPSFEVMKAFMLSRTLVGEALAEAEQKTSVIDHVACGPSYGDRWRRLFDDADLVLEVIKDAAERLP